MQIRPEVFPFLVASLVLGLIVLAVLKWRKKSLRKSLGFALGVTVILCAYFLFFFRDPERISPAGNDIVVAGAEGTVAAITELYEKDYLKTNCVRISIFLSLFDVHVNRAPISGESSFLGYFPGKHLFTFQEKSSEVNQHNKILISGEWTSCLICQIVGPVCRRVVYWLPHDKPAMIDLGEKIGMMKFGSRLDMYLPADDVEIEVEKGDKVRAGETIIARAKRKI